MKQKKDDSIQIWASKNIYVLLAFWNAAMLKSTPKIYQTYINKANFSRFFLRLILGQGIIIP